MFARFLRNRRGSVLPMLAFTAVPLMAGVGVAVDYSRATAAKAQFQAALDSTALMLSKNAADLSAADVVAALRESIKAVASSAFWNAVRVVLAWV